MKILLVVLALMLSGCEFGHENSSHTKWVCNNHKQQHITNDPMFAKAKRGCDVFEVYKPNAEVNSKECNCRCR